MSEGKPDHFPKLDWAKYALTAFPENCFEEAA